jgi:DNA-binding MarR family transcriptional regulator
MPDRIGLRALIEIGIVDKLGTMMLERSMHHELTLSQFMVLDHIIQDQDNNAPRSLAEKAQVTKATMTSSLQRLSRKGFIISKADTVDHRSKRVALTDIGHAAYIKASNAMMKDLIEIQRDFGFIEFEAILSALSNLKTCFELHRRTVISVENI